MNSPSGNKEDTTSPNPNSAPSLTPPRWMEMMSEPIADRESVQGGATEPENTSDQICHETVDFGTMEEDDSLPLLILPNSESLS